MDWKSRRTLERMLGRTAILLAALAALFASTAATAGATPLGSQLQVSSGGGASDAAVASRTTTGSYIVVWSQGAIYGRRYDRYGKQQGAPFKISDTAGSKPDVVYNAAADEYLVVWSSADPGSAPRIMGRRIHGGGLLLGGVLTLSTEPEPDSYVTQAFLDPAVTYNRDRNEYLVAWERKPIGEYPDVSLWARRVAADGTPLGTDTSIGGWSEHYAAVDVAYDAAAKGYLAVYVAYCGGCGGYKIVNGLRLTALGAQNGNPFEINQYPAVAYGDDPQYALEGFFNSLADTPAVAYNARTGQMLVTWADGSAYSGSYYNRGREVDIRGQLLQNGARVGRNFVISRKVGLTGIQNRTPAVAWHWETNQFLVAWSDPHEIYAVRLNSAGARVSAPDVRTSWMGPDRDPAYAAQAPAVAAGLGSQYLIAWHGDDAIDDVFDVYARRFGS